MFEDHNYSDWVGIPSGVPQGSVCPLLFIMHINFVNDLPDVVSGMLSIFAFDTKLFIINIVKSSQDQLVLQQDLDNLQAWSGQWQMFFNFDKCHSMSIGRSPGLFSYTMESPDCVVTLATTSEECDLCVVYIQLEVWSPYL